MEGEHHGSLAEIIVIVAIFLLLASSSFYLYWMRKSLGHAFNYEKNYF